MYSTDAERVVHDFLTRLGPTPADVRSTVDHFLTDDCVWENPGSPVCRGKREIFALLPADFARLEVRFRHMATTTATTAATTAADRAVLTERIESMYRADGTPIALNLKVMAAFELRNGRISAWRDFFDFTHLISERPDW